jgi:hypothetical protein
MGPVWGWGQGSIRLGGSVRARIASCHNNLLLSSRLIDGTELALRLMPLEPQASPSLAGPWLLWDPQQPRHLSQLARPLTCPQGTGALGPCPLSPLLVPLSFFPVPLTLCPSCLPSWVFDSISLLLILITNFSPFCPHPPVLSLSVPCVQPSSTLISPSTPSVFLIPCQSV